MTEEIGSVKLDYSKYPGKDYYCDGGVEDEILEIVKKHSPAEYGKVIEERRSWPVLYHLSPLRENIVDWLPMKRRTGFWRWEAAAELSRGLWPGRPEV